MNAYHTKSTYYRKQDSYVSLAEYSCDDTISWTTGDVDTISLTSPTYKSQHDNDTDNTISSSVVLYGRYHYYLVSMRLTTYQKPTSIS